MRLAYKMEYIYPTEEDTGIEMVNYSSQYQEEYKKIYNDGYHKMREALDIKPYDFIQDNSFFEEGMDDVFLLIEKNEIIGTVALKKDEIDDLIVNSKYKGQGYGKQILLWALKNIQTQRPILHVAGWNEEAVALYKNIGFEITETIEI